MSAEERKLDAAEAEVLQRIVTGDLLEDAPEAQEFLASPELRARLDALRSVAAVLDAAAHEESETLARAEAMDAAPGSERVEETLAGVRATSADDAEAPPAAPAAEPRRAGPRSSGPFARFVRIVAAAGLLVVVGVDLFAPKEPEPGLQILLGSGDVEIAEPIGEEQSFARFSWRSIFPADTTYHLRIEDATEDGDPDWSYESDALMTLEWTPPEELEWPDRIRWEVEARDSSGGYLGIASAYASR